MTVKELKAALDKCDDTAHVVYYNSDDKMAEVVSATEGVITDCDIDYILEDCDTLTEGTNTVLLI